MLEKGSGPGSLSAGPVLFHNKAVNAEAVEVCAYYAEHSISIPVVLRTVEDICTRTCFPAQVRQTKRMAF